MVAVDGNGNRGTLPAEGTFSFQVGSPAYALYQNLDGEGPTNPFLRGAGGKQYEIFFDLPAAHVFKIRNGMIHEIEAIGYIDDSGITNGWE